MIAGHPLQSEGVLPAPDSILPVTPADNHAGHINININTNSLHKKWDAWQNFFGGSGTYNRHRAPLGKDNS